MRRVTHILTGLIVLTACGIALGQTDYPGGRSISIWQQSVEMQRDYIEYLKKQLAAEPDNTTLQLELGRAYYWLAVWREGPALFEAEKIFEQILTRDPNNAIALAYHGSLLGLKIGLGLVPPDQLSAVGQRAYRELDRAVALAPDSIEVREFRGYANFYTPSSVGRDQLAVEDFTHAIKLLAGVPKTEEHRAELYVILGDTYNKMGDRQSARASWQRAIQLAPGSSQALGAEARLRTLEFRISAADNTNVLTSFLGFLVGVIIFALLTVPVGRDLVRARRRRGGMIASFVVSLTALAWNGLNLWLALRAAVGSKPTTALRLMMAWQEQDGYLILALSPIPLGLLVAYRFYKATFMDVVLKRGAALLVMFMLPILYGRLFRMPFQGTILQVPSPTLRSILFALPWVVILAFYLPLRNFMYRVVDRYLFKRRDYSQLFDWFNERVQSVTDEASLIEVMSDSLREAFTADSVRFVPASDELALKLSAAVAQGRSSVLLRQRVADDELEADLEKRRVELVVEIRSSHELLGFVLIGPRAYGQGFLSEELSVLRAVAAQIGRTWENLRLHEARRKQAIAEEELRKLAAQAELKALRAQIDPHFFFNSLNSVASLIPDNPDAAEALLEDLADLFRHSFKPSPEFIPLEQELDLVETYLSVEKVRLGEKLQFKKVITPEALVVRIPALTIQPLVENAVKHGIGRLNHGGTITLSATVRNGCLNVAVADTGIGIYAVGVAAGFDSRRRFGERQQPVDGIVRRASAAAC